MENKKKAGALLLTTGLAGGVAASTAQTNVTSAGFMDWVREKGSSLVDRSVGVMSKVGKTLFGALGYLSTYRIASSRATAKYFIKRFYGIDEAKERERQIRVCARVVRDELEKELKINIDEKIVDEVYNKVSGNNKSVHSHPDNKRMQNTVELVKENLDERSGVLRDYLDKRLDGKDIGYPHEKDNEYLSKIYQGIKEIMSIILQDRMKKN